MTAPKKAPCVDVRTDVHKDVRFEVLAELAGMANKYEALGRMHHLWSWCVDRGLQDAPEHEDGYVVPETVIRRFLGTNGVTAILGDDVDEFALGERRDGGRIYLRGTSDYVSERRARAAVASAGGSARANGSRDDAGRFVNGTTNVQPEPQPQPSRPPAAGPAANQPTPASSSSDLPLPTSGSQNPHTRARERHPDAGGIARRVWDHGAKVRGELSVANIKPLPAWPIMHDANHPGWTLLLDRVGELLVNSTAEEAERIARNRVDVAKAKAIDDGNGEYFSPTGMFSPTSFAHWAQLDPSHIGRKRAGPKRAAGALIGAAKPRSDHPESSTLKPFNEL